MSLARRYFLRCDDCRMETSLERDTAAAALKLAKQNGWRRRKDAEGNLRDTGPVCRAGERRRAEEASR